MLQYVSAKSVLCVQLGVFLAKLPEFLGQPHVSTHLGAMAVRLLAVTVVLARLTFDLVAYSTVYGGLCTFLRRLKSPW